MPTALWRKKLKTLRKKHGESQSGLASKLQTSQQTIGNWENDIGSPNIEQMLEITNFFGISIDDFLNKDFANAHLNTKNIGKENDDKSAPKRARNSTPNSEKEEKHPFLRDDQPAYGQGVEPTAEFWREKYISLLEKRAAKIPTDYVPLETYEVLATRFDALQAFVLEQLSALNHKGLKELALLLHTKGNDLMKEKKKRIHSEAHS